VKMNVWINVWSLKVAAAFKDRNRSI